MELFLSPSEIWATIKAPSSLGVVLLVVYFLGVLFLLAVQHRLLEWLSTLPPMKWIFNHRILCFAVLTAVLFLVLSINARLLTRGQMQTGNGTKTADAGSDLEKRVILNGSSPSAPTSTAQPHTFDFTHDTSLNTKLWTVNGPVASAALPNFDSPPAAMVTPNLTFSPALGLGMSGVNGTYVTGGIQSVQFFTPPFTVEAVGMSTSARPGLALTISSQKGGSGVGIIGGQGYMQKWIGFWLQSPSGPGTYWNQVSKFTDTAPQAKVWYTITVTVDASGKATASVSASGTNIGQATTSVGTGPFYVIVSQGAGAGFQSPQNYWRLIAIH